MYRDTNVVVFGGRLVADPETKTINGDDCVKFRMVVNNGVEEGSGMNTLYLDCEWWSPNKGASYLEKGKKVEVQGKLQMSHWKDKGDGSSRSRPYLKVLSLELRGTKKDSEPLAEDNFVSSINDQA
jgi:hypothetical protein